MRFNNSIRAAITEQDFVNFILDGQPEPPLYFARMKRDNKMGPKVLGDMPKPQKMTADEFVSAVHSNESAVVIDTREREAFMDKHLKGALFAPVNKAFNTTVGSFVMEDEHMYLVVEEDKLHEAILDLIRIGLDNISGYITPSELYAKEDLEVVTTETITFSEFDDIMSLVTIGYSMLAKNLSMPQARYLEHLTLLILESSKILTRYLLINRYWYIVRLVEERLIPLLCYKNMVMR
jgi:hydroxyacylglutathione hydrolase